MQRIMEAQAYKSRSDSSQDFYSKQKKKFEINPRHPLIKSLNERIQEDEEDASALANAQLLFDTAVLQSNYDLRDKAEFAARILNVMYENLGIDKDSEVDEEPEIDEDEEEEEAEEDFEEIDADEDEDPDDFEPVTYEEQLESEGWEAVDDEEEMQKAENLASEQDRHVEL